MNALMDRQKEFKNLSRSPSGKWLRITYQLPDDWQAFRHATEPVNGENPLDQKFHAVKGVAKGRDPMEESAKAAARYILKFGQDPSAQLEYVKLLNGIAHVKLKIEGWAGVGVIIANLKPIVEKTLLQFPQVKRVLWDPENPSSH